MKSPYRDIAFFALTKWNGKTEEEATKMANLLTVDELDGHVWAKGSVNHAIDSIAMHLHLSEEDKKSLTEAVYEGPADSEIFKKVGKLINETPEKEILVLCFLADIHDGWVKDNCSEKTFNKKVSKKQLKKEDIDFIKSISIKEKDLLCPVNWN